jgi:hypothetical protein
MRREILIPHKLAGAARLRGMPKRNPTRSPIAAKANPNSIPFARIVRLFEMLESFA